MSSTIGRSIGTERRYRVPNYSVAKQTLTNPSTTIPPSTGQNVGSPNSMNQVPPTSTSGTMPNTSTMPGRGTTSPTTPTTPGIGNVPQIIPSPATPPRTTPSTGTRMNPSTGTVTTPAPGMGTSTAPGMGTTTAPSMGTMPAPGMGTTPTPGTGTGTSPMRPGSTTTPAPGMGTTPAPGMVTTPAPTHTPYIYGTNPETPITPSTGNTTAEPSSRQPVNPQSMTPSGMTMPEMQTPSTAMPGTMPYISYPPYQGIPNMYLPNSNTYQVPMGIPLFPLYGYDNSADLDRDLEYMKQLYPKTARIIQKEIDDECDKMEYDGSMMFDEYPDKEYLDKLTDRIYQRIKQIEDEPQVEMNSLYFYPPRRNTNYLRDMVSLLLLSELFNRRRRYRSRRRWF